MTTDIDPKKPRKPRKLLTEDQKALHGHLRRWMGNPTVKVHLERFLNSMVDYELRHRLRHD